MLLELEWLRPIPLEDGSDQNLLYTCDADRVPSVPGLRTEAGLEDEPCELPGPPLRLPVRDGRADFHEADWVWTLVVWLRHIIGIW